MLLCFQEPNVSMIITDYWMPEMTGFELLKKVKVCARIVRLHSAAAVQPQMQIPELSNRDLNRMACLIVCMQESSRLKEIPVVIMSSENVPTRISRLPRSHAQPLNLFISFQCF